MRFSKIDNVVINDYPTDAGSSDDNDIVDIDRPNISCILLHT